MFYLTKGFEGALAIYAGGGVEGAVALDDFVRRKTDQELKAVNVLCVHTPQQTIFVEDFQKTVTWSRSMPTGPDFLSQSQKGHWVVSKEINIKDALGRRQIKFL